MQHKAQWRQVVARWQRSQIVRAPQSVRASPLAPRPAPSLSLNSLATHRLPSSGTFCIFLHIYRLNSALSICNDECVGGDVCIVGVDGTRVDLTTVRPETRRGDEASNVCRRLGWDIGHADTRSFCHSRHFAPPPVVAGAVPERGANDNRRHAAQFADQRCAAGQQPGLRK